MIIWGVIFAGTALNFEKMGQLFQIYISTSPCHRKKFNTSVLVLYQRGAAYLDIVVPLEFLQLLDQHCGQIYNQYLCI